MKRAEKPWVLGVSNSHNGAACLLKGNEIVAAIQEERVTRIKRKRIRGSLPILAIKYCLDAGGIQAKDLNLVVSCTQGLLTEPIEDIHLNPVLQSAVNDVPVLTISHHLAHSFSAFALSGFDTACSVVVDGVGSPERDLSAAEKGSIKEPKQGGWESISIYEHNGSQVTPLEKHLVEGGRWLEHVMSRMPKFGTLGGMFSSTSWQIFGSFMEAGKVMGLAPYGSPVHPVDEFLTIEDGSFVFTDAVCKHYQHERRWPDCKDEYQNLAASVQAALEEALHHLVERSLELSEYRNLCYSGGVALNSVANEKVIARHGAINDFYIIPSAEDNGPAIGAAFYGLWQLEGYSSRKRICHDSFGKQYSDEELDLAIKASPAIRPVPCDDPVSFTVEALCNGHVVGWFQGKSEFGARALGCRSILCDPRSPDAKHVLNSRVKHREPFRPFAPAVLAEKAEEWFEMGAYPESPFMLRICKVKQDKQALVPAIVHVDGTGRLQTVKREDNEKFYDILQAFYKKTGVPILVNTSFNVMGEPIVEGPGDALWALISTGIDYCILGDKVFEKADLGSVLDLYPHITSVSYSVHHCKAQPGNDEQPDWADSFALFDVTTLYGRISQVTNLNVFPLLKLIDGKSSGWQILEALQEKEDELLGKNQRSESSSLSGAFQKWRTWHLTSGLTEVDPVDIVETLWRERVASYDEKTVLKMLGRLQRSGIVGFRERPKTSARDLLLKARGGAMKRRTDRA